MVDVSQLKRISNEDIVEANVRIKDKILLTPLIPFNQQTDEFKIYLKLENLQSVGSFKIRGACNAILNVLPEQLKQGVYSCSAGNFAQGLAWNAQQMNIPCTIIAPETAPVTKIEAVRNYGSTIIKVPYEKWWNTMVTQNYEDLTAHFIHPVCNRHVIAGNGTIGLEILNALPDVDVIIGPFGGGGLLCGVASAVKHYKPEVKIIACEVETAAPLTASFAAKHPTVVVNHKSSFVDGMGGKSLFAEMWNLASNLIDATITLNLDEISEAVRLLVSRNHIVAEGAGAATLAAALSTKFNNIMDDSGGIKGKKVACIVSGGNIDNDVLTTILQGKTPS